MLSKNKLVIWGLMLFFFFVFFSYVVHKDKFTQTDFDTTVILQDHITRRVDGLFSVFSEIGKFEILVTALVVLFVFLRKIVAGILAMSAFAGLHLIELYGKFFVDHPPPPHFMLRTQEIGSFPQFYVRSDNSYPSGHSGRTIFISVILLAVIWRSNKLNRFFKLFLSGCVAGFDLIMLVSRVYLGEHWASDVVGGALLGAALGLVSAAFIRKAGDKKSG